jgi:hypothetical protein
VKAKSELRCPVDSSVFAEREGDVRDVALDTFEMVNGVPGYISSLLM